MPNLQNKNEMVEETEKSSTAAVKEEAEKNSSSMANPKEEDAAGGNSDVATAPSKEIAPPPPARHPLEHAWTFWFDNPSAKSKQAAWGSSIRPIYTFSTVEDFWSVYNNIHHPSKLAVEQTFIVSKIKLSPNGKTLSVPMEGSGQLVFLGENLTLVGCIRYLLAMIGEQFDYGDEICGAVVNVRARQEKIALWTKNAANEAAQLSIGRQWKEFLDYSDSIGFIFHDDAKRLDRNAKNRYTV
ncbi:UNVERIFIED_CONTAM: Eukaryotic translation initiation factor 4E-1 [Sesamum latifolium]|uniref:eIF-4F 25 kDa subunit n=1 Tax=Sesamum latifolium TaxID=2727402 RepID=A0AAW2TT35_9LAMI